MIIDNVRQGLLRLKYNQSCRTLLNFNDFLVCMMEVVFSLFILILFYSGCFCSEGPCSTAHSGSIVVDICSSTVAVETVNEPFLLRVSTMQQCRCTLSVLNYDSITTVKFSKYQSLLSSHPKDYSCGVGIRFGYMYEEETRRVNWFWNIQCNVDNQAIYGVETDHVILIESFNVNGTLKPTKGYCIEITQETNTNSAKRLQLKCGNVSVSQTVIPVTTTLSEEGSPITMPSSTSLSVDNSFQLNRQSPEVDNTQMYTAIGGSIGGLVLVGTIIFIFIFRRRSKRKKTEYQENEVSTYDADELQYNALYLPTETTHNSELNCGFEHEHVQSTRASDDHYSETDNDDGQQKQLSSVSDKPKATNKPRTAPKPEIKGPNTSSIEPNKIRYMNIHGENASEYVVVDKSKKTKLSEGQSMQTGYNAPSGDVYAQVIKPKLHHKCV